MHLTFILTFIYEEELYRTTTNKLLKVRTICLALLRAYHNIVFGSELILHSAIEQSTRACASYEKLL